MSGPKLDDEMAHLYQLPLADFTASRNVLAKRAGSRAADVRALKKPAVAAWAINQIYWRQREVYDRLIAAASEVRATHAGILSGKGGDVRAAGKAHEEAISATVKSALAVLRDAGQPATDLTRQAIASTLRALPVDEAPGQLTETLQPGGFEMLAGLHVHGKTDRPAPAERKPVAKPARGASPVKEDPAEQRRIRARAEEADRAVRLAEHAAHREAFDAARAAREADQAVKAVTAAQQTVDEAARALEEAEQLSAKATKAREAAARRAAQTDAALQTAREHARTVARAR